MEGISIDHTNRRTSVHCFKDLEVDAENNMVLIDGDFVYICGDALEVTKNWVTCSNLKVDEVLDVKEIHIKSVPLLDALSYHHAKRQENLEDKIGRSEYKLTRMCEARTNKLMEHIKKLNEENASLTERINKLEETCGIK